MASSTGLVVQGHHLLQIGVALLLFVCLQGFVIPRFLFPHQGLSVHTLATFEALVFLALGLTWPILKLGQNLALATFWLFVYSAFSTLIPYILGALWGAGNSIMPLAARAASGNARQERTIKMILYSSAPTAIAAFVLILWGLRT